MNKILLLCVLMFKLFLNPPAPSAPAASPLPCPETFKDPGFGKLVLHPLQSFPIHSGADQSFQTSFCS